MCVSVNQAIASSTGSAASDQDLPRSKRSSAAISSSIGAMRTPRPPSGMAVIPQASDGLLPGNRAATLCAAVRCRVARSTLSSHPFRIPTPRPVRPSAERSGARPARPRPPHRPSRHYGAAARCENSRCGKSSLPSVAKSFISIEHRADMRNLRGTRVFGIHNPRVCRQFATR